MTQKNLKIHNTRFITYSDELLKVDVLGGIDTYQIERMICTLRITHQNYPPIRTTLDLYTDNQTDKLIRTLCDKWNLRLTESSKSVHGMIAQLESYKLQQLKYPQQQESIFEITAEEVKQTKEYLKDENLITNLQTDLEKMGIIGEQENALILFLAMASHKFSNPFSVLCLAKSGMGKSYLLQKLADCLPKSAISFHTQMSDNALYYFESHQIDGKVLFIEDLEWTQKMLNPLAILQTQGRLVKTRATKDKDGMLHSTSFEIRGKLCFVACAKPDKNYEGLSLPFLCLPLNQDSKQDKLVMEYQKKLRAGLVNEGEASTIQRKLKCVLASLKNVSIVNPYAPFIDLPEHIPYPSKTLHLLLNFIDVITFFQQHQRESKVDTQTGEVSILTAPKDIELAFRLLKGSLFRRVDELSSAARKFYDWLEAFLEEAQTKEFTALDIRKVNKINPRTLNNYLNELKLFSYVQVVGGNKHREGYRYKLTELSELANQQSGIEKQLNQILERISQPVSQNLLADSQSQATTEKVSRKKQKIKTLS